MPAIIGYFFLIDILKIVSVSVSFMKTIDFIG